jgi:hypothetical protein
VRTPKGEWLRSQNVVMLTEMAKLRDSDGGVNDGMWMLRHLPKYQRLAGSVLDNMERLVAMDEEAFRY